MQCLLRQYPKKTKIWLLQNRLLLIPTSESWSLSANFFLHSLNHVEIAHIQLQFKHFPITCFFISLFILSHKAIIYTEATPERLYFWVYTQFSYSILALKSSAMKYWEYVSLKKTTNSRSMFHLQSYGRADLTSNITQTIVENISLFVVVWTKCMKFIWIHFLPWKFAKLKTSVVKRQPFGSTDNYFIEHDCIKS